MCLTVAQLDSTFVCNRLQFQKTEAEEEITLAETLYGLVPMDSLRGSVPVTKLDENNGGFANRKFHQHRFETLVGPASSSAITTIYVHRYYVVRSDVHG